MEIGERSKYLHLAETIISLRGVPLTASEIIDVAREYDLLPFVDYTTVKKTLQARLAEEIAANTVRSRFFRTGVGTYFLRSLMEEREKLVIGARDIIPLPRGKPSNRSRVLLIGAENRIKGVGWESIQHAAIDSVYSYLERRGHDYVPVICGEVIFWSGYVYSYRLGVHTDLPQLIGQKSVLVRKYVDEFDLDLFDPSGAGLYCASVRTALPIISAGRISRLHGAVRKGEHENLFDRVLHSIRHTHIFRSTVIDAYVASCLIDLSDVYETRPPLHRRLEHREAGWLRFETLRGLELDRDSHEMVNFLQGKLIS